MRIPIAATVTAWASLAISGVAYGDEATATITVEVPPIAEAMEAQSSGAAGFWTVRGRGSGFMVAVHADETPDARPLLSISRGSMNRVQVALMNDDSQQMLTGRTQDANGALTTLRYDLPDTSPSAPNAVARILFSPQ